MPRSCKEAPEAVRNAATPVAVQEYLQEVEGQGATLKAPPPQPFLVLPALAALSPLLKRQPHPPALPAAAGCDGARLDGGAGQEHPGGGDQAGP